MAADALALIVESYIEQGKPLPDPKPRRGRKYRLIRLPAIQSMKAELYRQFLAAGIRKVELARGRGIPKTLVDRLFDLRHQSGLDQMEAAFRALGKELTIEVRGAA